jgi:hypothetical protein
MLTELSASAPKLCQHCCSTVPALCQHCTSTILKTFLQYEYLPQQWVAEHAAL